MGKHQKRVECIKIELNMIQNASFRSRFKNCQISWLTPHAADLKTDFSRDESSGKHMQKLINFDTKIAKHGVFCSL